MDNEQPHLDLHRKLAIDLFNHTWDLLDKEKRSPVETD